MALICFDLDGTLVDPLPALLHAVSDTCSTFGLPCPSEQEVSSQVGYGMQSLFEKSMTGLSEAARRTAMERFWNTFQEDGIYEHRLYDGVPLMLSRLQRQGHRLVLVTTKPGTYARRVAHHFDLILLFEAIVGPGRNEPWKSKTDIMRELCQDGTLCEGGLLVGDRGDDMKAAKTHRLKALGVTWGFGSREELIQAGADQLFEHVESLDAFFQNAYHEPERHSLITRAE